MRSYLTLGNALILLVAVVVTSYLFIDNYDPRLGVVGNAIYGEIDLTYSCPVAAQLPQGAVLVTKTKCGPKLRYRWLLLPLFGLLTSVAIMSNTRHRSTRNHRSR